MAHLFHHRSANFSSDKGDVMDWRRAISMAVFASLLIAVTSISTSTTSAHPPSSGSCSSAPGNRWYGIFRTSDLASANAKAGQAGWEEQNYQVWDHFAASNRFVLSDMWIGFPNATFVEVGFKRTPSCNGNCFFRARRTTSGHLSLVINKAPQGAHTWHVYKLEFSTGGASWVATIDGQSYGGFGGLATSATRMTVGIELTSNCSVAHTTYFGSPSTSSSYAFRYKTGAGYGQPGDPATDPATGL